MHGCQKLVSRRAATVALLGLAALIALAPARAGFVVTCSKLTTARADPIVTPGNVSAHAHVVFGSSAFSLDTTYADTQRNGVCTTCSIGNDFSNYWTPALYYRNPATRALSLVGVDVVNAPTRIYYRPHIAQADLYPLQEFPPGFQMIAGSAFARSPNDAIAFKCVGDTPTASVTETTFQGRFPDTAVCNYWQAVVEFPSCWNGKAFNRSAMTAHMAYPLPTGACPSTHPRRFLTLTIFVNFHIGGLNARPQDFVLANGDPTGMSMHADFLNGWPKGVLQANIDCVGITCNNIFPNLQSPATQQACDIPKTTVMPSEPVTSSSGGTLLKTLPGNPCSIPGNVCGNTLPASPPLAVGRKLRAGHA